MNASAMTLHVRIHIAEALDERWAAWLDGVSVLPCAQGGSELAGPLPDRSALHGLLDRIRDLNLSLLSVQVTYEPDSGGIVP